MFDVHVMTIAEFKEVPGIDELIKAHWAELPNFGGGELNVSWDMYQLMGETLTCFLLTKDDVPTGYALFNEVCSRQTDDVLAVNDVLYLAPEVRGQGVGPSFIRNIESYYYEDGVAQMVLQFKPHAVPVGMLEELGYSMSEVQYAKVLTEE